MANLREQKQKSLGSSPHTGPKGRRFSDLLKTRIKSKHIHIRIHILKGIDMNIGKAWVGLVAAFCLIQILPASQAIAQETFKKTVFANNENGFHDKEGNVVNNEAWKVSKGTQVEIVFKFDGNMDPEEEEEHELHMSVLRHADGTKPEKKLVVRRLQPLSATTLEQTLSFTAGEFDEKILKIYCKTDCDGMDYMDNLRIEVD